MRTPVERQAIEDAMSELRAEGYSVATSLQDLPGASHRVQESLAQHVFDFVGLRDSHLVVGQVLVRGGSDASIARRLAVDLNKLEDVEYRLVWLGQVELAVPDVNRVIELAGQGFELVKATPDAAFLVAWSALEGALEILSSNCDVELLRSGSGSAQLLYSRGVISRTLYERIRYFAEVRNSLVHMPSRFKKGGRTSIEDGATQYIAQLAWTIAEGRFRTVDENLSILAANFASKELQVLASWPTTEPDGALVKEVYRAIPLLDPQELAELANVALDLSRDKKPSDQ